MYRIVVESGGAEGALEAVIWAQKAGLRIISIQEGEEVIQDILDRQIRPTRRRVTRVAHKPVEGERLQDYVLKVLEKAKVPLSYREIGQLAKQAGYKGGMASKVISSCSPVLSTLAKDGKVRKLPNPHRKGFVYELA